MKDELLQTCNRFIRAYDNLANAFSREDTRLKMVCAASYTAEQKTVNPTNIANMRQYIKSKSGLFSEIRGTALPLLLTTLDKKGANPADFDAIQLAHNMLRKQFSSSSQLVLGASILANNADSSQFESIILRAKDIYKMMKSNHPFLTGPDDYVMCILLAMSEKDNNTLVNEMEQCYTYLNNNLKGISKNSKQTLSHILALYEADTVEKCQRVIDLFNTIKSSRCKFNAENGIAILALLTQLHMDHNTIVADMKEISEYLKQKKGFGNLGLGEHSRMVFSAMLLNQTYSNDNSASTSVASGILTSIIAEQMAMITIITTTTVATTVN